MRENECRPARAATSGSPPVEIAAGTMARRTFLWQAMVAMGCLSGCAGYRWGNETLYRTDIRTVHVPIFQSDSYRRFLAEWLTEAVIKEIELTTPYKVVGAGEADSVLIGRIVRDEKQIVAEDKYDVPRNIDAKLLVEVRWQNSSGNLFGNAAMVPLPDAALQIAEASTFLPEFGQSLTTAQEKVVVELAQHIVGQMENPW